MPLHQNIRYSCTHATTPTQHASSRTPNTSHTPIYIKYNCLQKFIQYLPEDGQRKRAKHVVEPLCNKHILYHQ